MKKILFLSFLGLSLSCATPHFSISTTAGKYEGIKTVFTGIILPPVVNKPPERSGVKLGENNTKTISKTTKNLPKQGGAKTQNNRHDTSENIVKTALSYLGTPYKYGGTSHSGMDCSGFVYTSFLKNNITLNRASYEMANQGTEISLRSVKKGDLLFFKTTPKGRISHVGIVIEDEPEVRFVHSATKRGVVINSMKESYWQRTYIKSTRVIN